MIGTIPTDSRGNILAQPSLYNPPKDVVDITSKIRRDYEIGYEIQHRSFSEFNDLSVLGIMDRDQRAFNNYVQPKSQNPDETWRFNGIRPVTRNKLIGIAAHTTAVLMFPGVFAQNESSQEDKEAAHVMEDLIEYDIRNSEYELEFLFAVVSALVNPCVYLEARFDEVMQTIKEKNESGMISRKDIVDEVLSGFHANVIPVDEMLIANAYEFEHQRQRFVVRKRLIDYDEADALHGKHEYFKHVKPGVKTLYADTGGGFFEVQDDSFTTLVEEVTYRNRREDMEITFVNGIFVSDTTVDSNRIKHRDTNGAPRYSEAKSGYEPIDDGRFYYYKSAASKFAPEQEQVTRMYQLLADGAFLETISPQGVYGGEVINASVMVPGRVTHFGRDSRMESIGAGRNMNALVNAIDKMETSITESSQDNLRSGISGPGGRTAFEISKEEQNARIQLGLFGKLIGRLIKDFGNLMIDIIVNHQTVAEVIEKTGDEAALKFPAFLLPDKSDKGQKVTKRIEFTNDVGGPMTKEQQMSESFKMMRMEGGFESDQRLIKVNPELFRNLKFKIQVHPERLLPKNEELQKALNLEAWQSMIQSPFANREEVDREFLFETFAKGESAKYMQRAQQMLGQEPPEKKEKGKVTSNLVSSPGLGQLLTP